MVYWIISQKLSGDNVGKEFDYIEKFLQPLSGVGSHTLLDDTASIADYSISTDTMVQGVHFVGSETPKSLAIKLLSVNLSDLASVGATPKRYMLNVSLPVNLGEKWWESFSLGLKYVQDTYDITLLGGDSTTGSREIVLSATVFGEKNSNVPLRCNAQVGDIVCMVGTVGAGALGLLCAKGIIYDDALLQHYQQPVPMIHQGKLLAPLVHAMADVSDGLVADCFHMAKASNVGMALDIDAIALHPNIEKHCSIINNAKITAITGGDDYILVCTMDKINFNKAKNSVPEIVKIGTVLEDKSCVVYDSSGKIINLKGKHGYEHS